jgi:hypothetical protein
VTYGAAKITSKPLKNGHDVDSAAETKPENANTARVRRYIERKARGAVVLKAIVIEPDFIVSLAANGWLHESETRDAGAVEHALFALIMRALSSGMTPNPAKATLEIDVGAIRDALAWLPAGTQLTPQSAARAISTVSRCARTVNFGPVEFGERLKVMAGLN